MTVQRYNNKVFDNDKLYKYDIPENICIDEFTYKKKTMAFNICNVENGKTIDLVEDRSLDILNKYFSYYMKESRLKVKNVVMDMYKPYITLVKNNFPNANIIIDLFHIVQLISRSFNKTRIQVMKKDKTNYRKMKRYWRLLLKGRLDLDSNIWKNFLCFKNLMTEVDVVDYILNKNKELKHTYYLYQNILYALQHRNYNLFEEIISKDYDNISQYMKTSLETLREFSIYIKNTLEKPYSNGFIEGNNNFIKVIKRIAINVNIEIYTLILTRSLFPCVISVTPRKPYCSITTYGEFEVPSPIKISVWDFRLRTGRTPKL